jgi:hypothetical protein
MPSGTENDICNCGHRLGTHSNKGGPSNPSPGNCTVGTCNCQAFVRNYTPSLITPCDTCTHILARHLIKNNNGTYTEVQCQENCGCKHFRYLQASTVTWPGVPTMPPVSAQPVCDIIVEPIDPTSPNVVPKSVWINGVEVSGVIDIRSTATPGKPVEIQITLCPTSYTVGNPLGPGLDDEEGLPVVGERRLAMGEAMRRVRERRAKQNGG